VHRTKTGTVLHPRASALALLYTWTGIRSLRCGESSFPVTHVESRSFIPVRLGRTARQRGRSRELQIAGPSKSVRLAHGNPIMYSSSHKGYRQEGRARARARERAAGIDPVINSFDRKSSRVHERDSSSARDPSRDFRNYSLRKSDVKF